MNGDGRANAAVARALVAELAAAGVAHAVVCPGSRSTPVALALADNGSVRTWMHVDERSAGFFALGIARGTQMPVVLLCSSGTAAANFLPAVVEACYARVPLIVLTADRPPELRDVGAPQTIDQVRLYGAHAKWFVDLPAPADEHRDVMHARTIAARAVATALRAPAGPVHLNLPFREPLLPDVPLAPESVPPARTAVVRGLRALAHDRCAALAHELASVEDGIIVCGPQHDPAFAPAVVALAHALGWPVFADPLSGVRCGAHDRELVIDAYDAFMRDPATAARCRPRVVLRFGALPTSKALWQHLGMLDGSRHVVVDDGGGWRDPLAVASDILEADATQFCNDVVDALDTPRRAPTAWTTLWTGVQARTRAAIEAAVRDDDGVFEGRVFTELAGLLPGGAHLFAGNSMPVRDLDTFFPSVAAPVRIAANRGANGIDGVTSTALGIAAATSDRVVLVLGDLSFYHDSNGLLAAKLHSLAATIVVVDNDGGGIFSFLPQAASVPREQFEMLFGTPTGLEVERIAALYDARYYAATDWAAFRRAVDAGLRDAGLTIVHVRSGRDENVRRHRDVWERVRAALAG